MKKILALCLLSTLPALAMVGLKRGHDNSQATGAKVATVSRKQHASKNIQSGPQYPADKCLNQATGAFSRKFNSCIQKNNFTSCLSQAMDEWRLVLDENLLCNKLSRSSKLALRNQFSSVAVALSRGLSREQSELAKKQSELGKVARHLKLMAAKAKVPKPTTKRA